MNAAWYFIRKSKITRQENNVKMEENETEKSNSTRQQSDMANDWSNQK